MNEPAANGDKDKPQPASNHPTKEMPVQKVQEVIKNKDSQNNKTAPREKLYFSKIREWWNDPFRERASWTDKAIVLLTGGIVLLAYMQWLEMHGGGKQTDRIIAADERLATAMENAVTQANNSFTGTVNQFRLEQRAWVGVLGVTNLKFSANEPASFSVMATNSGKTPALHVKQIITGKSRPSNERFIFQYGPPVGLESETVIQPGMQVMFNTAPGDPLPQLAIDDIKSGKTVMRLHGRIHYDDVFGQKHQTTFCFILKPDLATTQWCSDYNEAD